MVRAILEGRKSQTRRAIKPQPPKDILTKFPCPILKDGMLMFSVNEKGDFPMWGHYIKCPYEVGMRLWVRETWGIAPMAIHYRADNSFRSVERHLVEPLYGITGWRPSIFMPRWARRPALEVTEVRVQRVQEISEEDARAEGIFSNSQYQDDWFHWERKDVGYMSAKLAYSVLWDSINGETYLWKDNVWVWAVSFKRV